MNNENDKVIFVIRTPGKTYFEQYGFPYCRHSLWYNKMC